MLGDFVASASSQGLRSEGTTIHHPHKKTQQQQQQHFFHIKTYGCQMNVNDTDIVRAILLEHGGYQEAATEDQATIWFTNTCAIREKAEQKVWNRLQTQKQRKLQTKTTKSNNTTPNNKRVVVGVLGCMAERLQEKLLQENVADLVVGPDAYRDLPRLLDQLLLDQPKDVPLHPQPHEDGDDDDNGILPWAMNVQLNLEETYSDILPIRSIHNNNKDSESPQQRQPQQQLLHSAFVSIQRGCSNRCSFCIVPFTRGQERSRPLDSILAEVTQLMEQDNLKEVVLLGQNVNSYHDRSEAALAANPLATLPGLSNAGFRNRIHRPVHEQQGGYTFVDLVEKIADLNPELRVRFTSPHPKDYPSELLHCMAERPNVCNQLHLPAQSGSTTMLKRMKRGYSREAYLQLIETVQAIIPDVALSSDFIAGFCGETEQEHEDTVTLLEQVQYEQAFLFAYSMREKTHAHRVMEDNVPASIKQARLQELIDTFRTNVHEKNQRVEVGKLRLVLVEGPAKRQLVATTSSSAELEQHQQHPSTVTWHGRTDQNKRILFPVQQHEDAALVLDESVANHHIMAAAVSTSSSSSSFATSKHNSAVRQPYSSMQMTTLNAGDYAVVEVTEAKGHTLRGRVLWKTTLANFARLETERLAKLHPEQLDGFKQQLIL
jgi:MiaB/RimO family radical SAM methylthiotransferase